MVEVIPVVVRTNEDMLNLKSKRCAEGRNAIGTALIVNPFGRLPFGVMASHRRCLPCGPH